jgi:hypothetical protein
MQAVLYILNASSTGKPTLAAEANLLQCSKPSRAELPELLHRQSYRLRSHSIGRWRLRLGQMQQLGLTLRLAQVFHALHCSIETREGFFLRQQGTEPGQEVIISCNGGKVGVV